MKTKIRLSAFEKARNASVEIQNAIETLRVSGIDTTSLSVAHLGLIREFKKTIKAEIKE